MNYPAHYHEEAVADAEREAFWAAVHEARFSEEIRLEVERHRTDRISNIWIILLVIAVIVIGVATAP